MCVFSSKEVWDYISKYNDKKRTSENMQTMTRKHSLYPKLHMIVEMSIGSNASSNA